MKKKNLQDFGIEYLLAVNGIHSTVYVPNGDDVALSGVKNFGLFKHYGNIETRKLEDGIITNPMVVAKDLNELERIFNARRVKSRANAIVNLKSSYDVFENRGYSLILYNICENDITRFRNP